MGVTSSKLQPDGSYNPSWMVTKLFSSAFGPKFDAKALVAQKQAGAASKGKILVVGTDKRFLTMKNGKKMNTGHNVSEVLVPLLHLDVAGYTFDFASATGGAFAFEEWSWLGPKKNGVEPELRELYTRLQPSHSTPMKTAAALELLKQGAYSAVFFPGGHGTMIEMGSPPDEGATGSILDYAHQNSVKTIVICHGPMSLLTASPETYAGYELVAFPDHLDAGQNVTAGYMPGHMTELQGELLMNRFKGMKLLNKASDDSTHVHKELISGAGPLAANSLGLKAVAELSK